MIMKTNGVDYYNTTLCQVVLGMSNLATPVWAKNLKNVVVHCLLSFFIPFSLHHDLQQFATAADQVLRSHQ
jgi:hypothetical protein